MLPFFIIHWGSIGVFIKMRSPDKFNTKSAIAYETLRQAIIEGRYKPGDKLTISIIAKKLGISDIPVREALQRLESDGLVENTPHVGFNVTSPEFDKYLEVFAVRQLLEGEATALAATNISPSALRDLGSLVQRMAHATEAGDVDALTQQNYQFHYLIYSSCGNQTLFRLVEQVWAIYPRTKSIFKLIPERAPLVQPEHEEIYLAIKNGQAEQARQALLTHKQRSYELLSSNQHKATLLNAKSA